MPIEIPDDWETRKWVEEPPLGSLVTVDSDAASGVVPTRWQVASWETTREIAASSLPGQVRAKTGLSVGTGKAVVKRDPDDFPWKKRAVYDLTGQDAQVLIAPQGSTEIPTGQFQVAEINGDLTTLGVHVDLDERTIEGRDKAANVRGWSYEAAVNQPGGVVSVDPVWWIAELAKQIGYGNGSLIPGQDGYAPILDVPMQGSLLPAHPQGSSFQTTDTIAWSELDGSLALSTENDSQILVSYPMWAALPQSFVVTADLGLGDFRVRWDGIDVSDRFEVSLYAPNDGCNLELTVSSVGSNGVLNTQTFVNLGCIDRDPDTPNRVQVEVTFAGAGTYTSASVRVRRDVAAAWTSPAVHAMTNTITTAESYDILLYLFSGAGGAAGLLSHVSIVEGGSTAVDALLTTVGGEEGRIYLEPLLGSITSPWLSPELTTWSAMQDVVEAWQGALITDVYGDLHVLNRLTLTGVGTGEEIPIDVGLKFEDLPWIANHADQADRLVVRYRPARVVTVASPDETKLPIVWEASEVIPTSPGGNDVFFNTEYLYLMYTTQIPWVQKGSPDFNEFYHTWDAYRYSNGTGTHMQPNSDVGIRIEQVTVSTWKVYIDNRTSAPFYMVDETGTPWLKVRSAYHMDQTQETFIERGASSGEARNPLVVDLSNYVQNEDDANAIADFIWGRARQRSWRADTISMVPDYRLDLGDVVELTHERTGVRSNALVTKVKLAGEPGQLTQHIDLVLIPPTWEDFDEVWSGPSGGTWDDFDALWAPYTWNDFDRTPTATTVAEIEEAL